MDWERKEDSQSLRERGVGQEAESDVEEGMEEGPKTDFNIVEK